MADDSIDDPHPQLQFSRGTMARCARCGAARLIKQTVVADGKRICKDGDDCARLKAHRAAEEDRWLKEQAKRDRGPAKLEEENFESEAGPLWLNRADLA